jgi:hypothetical protein
MHIIEPYSIGQRWEQVIVAMDALFLERVAVDRTDPRSVGRAQARQSELSWRWTQVLACGCVVARTIDVEQQQREGTRS